MSFYLKDLVHTVFGVDLPLPIPMFGLMVGIAFFVGLKVATLEVKRLLPSQPANLMDNAGLIAFFTGLVGARLFHLLEHPREFMADPMAMLFSRGGFTISVASSSAQSGLSYRRAKRFPSAGAGRGRARDHAIVRHRPHRLPDSGDGDWASPPTSPQTRMAAHLVLAQLATATSPAWRSAARRLSDAGL
jgi:hypothetical protein